MSRLFANNATTTLNTAISDSDTTLVVAPGTGSVFPTVAGSDWIDMTLEDDLGNVEIVRCSAHSAGSDTFTLSTRGVESTTPRAFSSGVRVEIRLTAAALNGWVGETDELDGGTF